MQCQWGIPPFTTGCSTYNFLLCSILVLSPRNHTHIFSCTDARQISLGGCCMVAVHCLFWSRVWLGSGMARREMRFRRTLPRDMKFFWGVDLNIIKIRTIPLILPVSESEISLNVLRKLTGINFHLWWKTHALNVFFSLVNSYKWKHLPYDSNSVKFISASWKCSLVRSYSSHNCNMQLWVVFRLFCRFVSVIEHWDFWTKIRYFLPHPQLLNTFSHTWAVKMQPEAWYRDFPWLVMLPSFLHTGTFSQDSWFNLSPITITFVKISTSTAETGNGYVNILWSLPLTPSSVAVTVVRHKCSSSLQLSLKGWSLQCDSFIRK